jgi:hypothetical protein
MPLIKDLQAQIFNGIAGRLIAVTAQARAGDFPQAVNLSFIKWDIPDLHLELNNAVNAGNYKEVGYAQNFMLDVEVEKVIIYHQGKEVASAKIERPR